MNIDEALRDLSAALEPDIRAALQRAYEMGYRQALAARPPIAGDERNVLPAAFTPAPEPDEAPPADDDAADPFAGDGAGERSGLFDFSGTRQGEGDEHEGDEAAAGSAHDALRELLPLIRSSASIGTLVRRIHHYFGLERFDVDVVVFRRGDRERRQLKTNVKLSKYVLGE